MRDNADTDFFRIRRPQSIVRALLRLLRLRTKRLKEQDRGDTITSVAAVLGDSGRHGTVTSRQHNDEWSVTLGPTAVATRSPEQN